MKLSFPPKVFYNDSDPAVCAWAQALIDQGEVLRGVVDSRSIADIQGKELENYVQCHFFAGILGWPVALKFAGWPEVESVWTGSCPCQSFSVAGKQRGFDDERHLWPEFHRLIDECRPSIVLGEQTESKLGREWLAGIQVNLEDSGYLFGACDLPASCLAAPHKRQRLFWGAVRRRDADRYRRKGFLRAGTAQEDADGIGTLYERLSDAADLRCERHSAFPGSSGKSEEDWRMRQSSGNGARTDGPENAEHGGNDGRRLSGCGESVETSGRRASDFPEGSSGANACSVSDPSCERIQLRGSTEAVRPAAGMQGENGQREWVRSDFGSDWTDAWSRYAVIPCGDGKLRRLGIVKPSPELLAPGLPRFVADCGSEGALILPLVKGCEERSGLLKGFGNSIVPQVGAVFIEAFMEALCEL